MQEMVIYGVSFDMVGKQPIVLLKTADGNKFLPIWIGHPEAAAILMKLQGASTPRPMTHDLLSEVLSKLDARVVKIAVTELRENTFYALITVCTHLGCTPNYLSAESKFKCPCHGSGFRLTGINFEGPAPRPLERARVVMADDGQVLIDKSRKFQYELGQWTDPEAFLKA